ncbi:DUF397 domain-containing protein [Streptomyces sp. NBC_00102]|uniref:DUF397 domain-containing protein n=1 Tax=Streptomyces sp. NBC_00102 TaxID=2975652 RepID=UPI00225A319E|nr:DUF397 domain-containing protein [Streptomyces sp. NBC_00102]MCX5400666.1 DUF397 domain-containing protein [Streptomyces sp. NBC_00102]
MNVHVTTDGSDAELHWFKSSHSGAEGGDCLEVATSPGTVHVRDSKQPTGPVLTMAPGAWAAFVAATAGD